MGIETLNQSIGMLVSNPPFTNKRKYFERALSFGKPFALIMTNTWRYSAPKQLFKVEDLQLLMFDKRMNYYDGRDNDKMDSVVVTIAITYYQNKLLWKSWMCHIKKVSQKTSSMAKLPL